MLAPHGRDSRQFGKERAGSARARSPRSGVPLSVCCLQQTELPVCCLQQTELPICCLQQTETHLVCCAFAPEDVARLEEAAVHEGLLDRGVIELAADVDDVADVRVDRVLEVVRVLPVEVPARDV